MNLFELFVKIGVDDQASGKLKDLGGKLGNGLATAAKIGTAAVGAAAAGITALTTAAVNNYAEYEQLVGGVDTLFKNASQKVQQYAADAYKTAGMSANDYMANATAFSASLISSLGGDTEKAAEYANRAMVSMSDNANKMGTSLDSIVQTYQSLSRGNMAMLDNLKLGYGGTKAELERLIADAASYTDIQKEMGITVDASSMSFDNIVNAIAVVQGKLGIAGATAEEAGSTIEGSINSMKAAWENLVTGIADGNADFEGLIGNFVESASVAFENLLPRVEVALGGVASLIENLAPKLIEKIPGIVSSVFPNLVSAIIGLVGSVADVLPSVIDFAVNDIIPQLLGAIEKIFNKIVSILPTLMSTILSALPVLIPQLVKTLASMIKILADELPGMITAIVSALPEIIKSLADSLLGDGLPVILEAVMTLIVEIVKILPDLLKTIISILPEWYKTLFFSMIELLPILLSGIGDLFMALLKDIPGILTTALLIANPIGPMFLLLFGILGGNFEELWDKITQLFKDAISAMGRFFTEEIPNAFNAVINFVKNNWQSLLLFITNPIAGALKLLYDLNPKFKEWVDNLLGKIKSWIGGIVNIGKDIVSGLKEGIQNAWDNLVSWFKGLFGDLIGIAKKILGIASPSKVFKKIGGFTAEGFGAGFEDEFAHVKDDMEDALNFDDASVGINASIRKVGAGVAGGAFGGTSIGNITINIDGAKYNDEQSLAEAVALAIQDMTDRRYAVYA